MFTHTGMLSERGDAGPPEPRQDACYVQTPMSLKSAREHGQGGKEDDSTGIDSRQEIVRLFVGRYGMLSDMVVWVV